MSEAALSWSGETDQGGWMTMEYVETRMIRLDDLTPFPGNARKGDRAGLLESLDRNGQYRSLVVRDTGVGLVVLAGNNTLEALRERGYPRARCEVIRCDDGTALRVNLVDNRSNDRAGYDRDALTALLRALDGDPAGSGYSPEDLDRYLPADALDEPPPSLDELEDTYGTHDEVDLWPVIRLRVPPYVRDRFAAFTGDGTPEEAFVRLLDAAGS